ncbi:hypothetical protein FHG87_009658 [Trinorchestia longiramus]|nr:hypothetical protein FHG87_009658 [Trinorchestia longiramus]
MIEPVQSVQRMIKPVQSYSDRGLRLVHVELVVSTESGLYREVAYIHSKCSDTESAFSSQLSLFSVFISAFTALSAHCSHSAPSAHCFHLIVALLNLILDHIPDHIPDHISDHILDPIFDHILDHYF